MTTLITHPSQIIDILMDIIICENFCNNSYKAIFKYKQQRLYVNNIIINFELYKKEKKQTLLENIFILAMKLRNTKIIYALINSRLYASVFLFSNFKLLEYKKDRWIGGKINKGRQHMINFRKHWRKIWREQYHKKRAY